MTSPDVPIDDVDQALDGDAKAIERLVKRLAPRFLQLASRTMLDRGDAEDAVQEALLRVLTHLSQWRRESRFSTWAWRIALRTILEFKEQRYRAAMMSFEEFSEDLQSGLDPSAVERPEDRILLSDLKIGCARALLQCLDGDHRIAYVLGEIMELEGPEAAEILEIDAAAFRKRLSRARERVQAALRAQCGIVNPAAACLCHRRLERAKALGRVGLDAGAGQPPLDLVTLRRKVQDCESLERAAAYYRADPAPQSRRDFVGAVRELIQTRQLS
jgi:RNA polymerase sigma factor (sigma-70 family)